MNCGCPGKWSITVSNPRGGPYYEQYAGFEYDDPYCEATEPFISPYQPGKLVLFSRCDGRNMSPPNINSGDSTWSIIGFVKDDPNCVSSLSNSTKTYDCLNGKCIENSQNSGYFKSLEDCQKLCAFSCSDGKQCVDPNTFCPPGKVCLDSSEYSQINSIITRLEQEFCN